MKLCNGKKCPINCHTIFLNVILVSCILHGALAQDYSADVDIDDLLEELEGENSHYVSTSEECARQCNSGEPSRICYYKFTAENYAVLGGACQLCTPNDTDVLRSDCQCVTADGYERGFLSMNRMLPGPSIQVCLGDRIVVDVENHLEGMELTIHWHGVFQTDTPYYDGAPMVTQCSINQGNTFRYNFEAGNIGTHFWHAHTGLQKMDGLYGSLVIRQPPEQDPNSNLYDYDLPEHVILVSDWMHDQATNRFPGLMQDPGQLPQSLLINGKGRWTDPVSGNQTNTPLARITVSKGNRYRFRIIGGSCSVCPLQLDIEKHELTLIATDGEPIVPVKFNTLIVFPGERYDFVLNAKQSAGSYWIQLRALRECAREGIFQVGILQYKGASAQPTSKQPTYSPGLPTGVVINSLTADCSVRNKSAYCVNQLKSANPIDPNVLNCDPDVTIYLGFRLFPFTAQQIYNDSNYKTFLVAPGRVPLAIVVNNISFALPPSPPLTQINDIPPEHFCNVDNLPAQCGSFCKCTQMFNIPRDAIVDVAIVDEMGVPDLYHPWHLHGHNFHVLSMGTSPDKNITKITTKKVRDMIDRSLIRRDYNAPVTKDTIAIPSNGYALLRFRADNPGYWLFHCHFIYHIPIGMDVLFHVGTYDDLPPIPKNFPKCGDFLPPITSDCY